MINLVNELLSQISLTKENIGFRYLNLGGKVVYIIGFKSIIKFSATNITFKINNSCILSVSGENLYIQEMDTSSAMVCGQIKIVEEV